ncbi:hypothetical protein MOP88_09380 [Sphingomonas sp. WKB10]|nr:hypothetical protein [Sphingomonas sp. WKB10]
MLRQMLFKADEPIVTTRCGDMDHVGDVATSGEPLDRPVESGWIGDVDCFGLQDELQNM